MMDLVEVLKNLSDEQKGIYMELERMFESKAWEYVRQ